MPEAFAAVREASKRVIGQRHFDVQLMGGIILHQGKIGETYAIGGNNEIQNIDMVHSLIEVTDRLLGRPEGTSMELISYVTDRLGHDFRYAIDTAKIEKELGWTPTTPFKEAIEITVKSFL